MCARIVMLAMQCDGVTPPTRFHSIKSVSCVRKIWQAGIGFTFAEANVERAVLGYGTSTGGGRQSDCGGVDCQLFPEYALVELRDQ